MFPTASEEAEEIINAEYEIMQKGFQTKHNSSSK